MPENLNNFHTDAIPTVGTVVNSYINASTISTGWININGTALYTGNNVSSYVVEVVTKLDGVIHPVLYFKYVKSKFKLIERFRMDRRLKYLEQAFDEAVAAGQNALGEKILKQLAIELRESAIYAKGIKYYVERDDVIKYKRSIRGGHISDTLIKDFTRIIPKGVAAKKERVKDVFDDFVVYHYWDEAAMKKVEQKQKMDREEKSRMRDPVLFGIIKETDRLYFIADWEDEYCDLTFSEIISVLSKSRKGTLTSKPELHV